MFVGSDQFRVIRITLEWSMYPRANPAAVELAGLTQNHLTFQQAAINPLGINADPPGQEGEGLRWIGITPPGANTAVAPVNSADIPVGGQSFPFTERGPSR